MNYYRVMLGQQSIYARECFEGGFIGADFGIHEDLSTHLAEDWKVFNRELIPIYLELHPEKTKLSAGLACGSLWTVAKGIREGDRVLSPTGSGGYRAGEVTGGYVYVAGGTLPHRRPVRWLLPDIDRNGVSDALRASMGIPLTASDISQYADEIDGLLRGSQPPAIIATDESVEDPYIFALEKHLEDFLVSNWSHTELGKEYDIYEEDGQIVGQQFPTDTGPSIYWQFARMGTNCWLLNSKRAAPAIPLWARLFAIWDTLLRSSLRKVKQ